MSEELPRNHPLPVETDEYSLEEQSAVPDCRNDYLRYILILVFTRDHNIGAASNKRVVFLLSGIFFLCFCRAGSVRQKIVRQEGKGDLVYSSAGISHFRHSWSILEEYFTVV